jgi:hypothetical protein
VAPDAGKEALFGAAHDAGSFVEGLGYDKRRSEII